ncbi:MAG: SDR family oxidoreductase [Pseudomonadota bacterium]
MNVIVFGATGSVGRLAVERILAKGHRVTAFARHPEQLALQHRGLTLHAGDAMNAADVQQAMAGHQAVVITLGAGANRKNRVRSQGTENIINAMQRHGIRRLICQSTLGVGESWSNLNFFWKHIMFGVLLRPVFQDHERQEAVVRGSHLEWTIVRPSAFTDQPASGSYRIDVPPWVNNLTLTISRADIADFLARCVVDTGFVQRAVAISN